MNAAVPGSPCSAGPPFHAYQYVRLVPSASRLVMLLRPFSLIRMCRDPIFQLVAAATRLGRRFAERVARKRDDEAARARVDLDAISAAPFRLLDGGRQRRPALPAPSRRGFRRTRERTRVLDSGLECG